jgi:glyoxylase-like metal-dependent hydrolase (beta-lactamase superfamily II)
VDTLLPDSLGIPLSSINAILLGHCHFDHSGNIAAFPPSVDLVVGPDSDPLDILAEKLDVPLKALQDRSVRYLDRATDKWVDVGAFKGLDYFGDGSLYLLDAPGVRVPCY